MLYNTFGTFICCVAWHTHRTSINPYIHPSIHRYIQQVACWQIHRKPLMSKISLWTTSCWGGGSITRNNKIITISFKTQKNKMLTSMNSALELTNCLKKSKKFSSVGRIWASYRDRVTEKRERWRQKIATPLKQEQLWNVLTVNCK